MVWEPHNVGEPTDMSKVCCNWGDGLRLADFSREAHCSAQVWDAAREMLEYFHWSHGEQRSQHPPFRALEIGAGTGWLGLALARGMGLAWQLTVSDMALAVPRLRQNVEANDCCASVQVREGDWGAPEGVLRDGFDLVFGSDLVYNDATLRLLPGMFRASLEAGAHVLYAHSLHRWSSSGVDRIFLEECSAAGLSLCPVWLQDLGPLADSPDESVSRYVDEASHSEPPQKRVVVFRVEDGDPDALGTALLTLSGRVSRALQIKWEEENPQEAADAQIQSLFFSLFDCDGSAVGVAG